MTTDPEGNKNVFQLWKEGGERLPFKVIRGRDATARKKKSARQFSVSCMLTGSTAAPEIAVVPIKSAFLALRSVP